MSRKSKGGSKTEEVTGPSGWKEQYDLIVELRKERDMPVDEMGAECIGNPQGDSETYHFEVLVGTMLSSQTKGEVSFEASKRLQAHGLTVKKMLATSVEKIQELIKPVEFYQEKAANIKKVAEILKKEHKGRVPNTYDDLVALPGVGPKLVHIILTVAFGVVSGLAVDRHIHHVSNVLGWVATKVPEETRAELEKWLPRDLWASSNALLVGFGQLTTKKYRFTLITRALLSSQPDKALALVVKAGVSIESKNSSDFERDSPLIWAVKENRPDLVALLLKHKASTTTINGMRKTAIDYATTDEMRVLLKQKSKRKLDIVKDAGEVDTNGDGDNKETPRKKKTRSVAAPTPVTPITPSRRKRT